MPKRSVASSLPDSCPRAGCVQFCGAGRYERSQARQDTRAGSYERTLQTSAGEVNLKVPKLAAPDLRDCDHRTLPPARELGRGSADRDVSGGHFGATGGGHYRSPLGHAGEPKHGVEPQQEDLREDRGLAEPAHRRRASVSLSRRHRDEAHLGWRGPQCLTAGGQRRQFRRFSGDSRHLRGRQGGQIRLVGVSASPGRSRPQRACS